MSSTSIAASPTGFFQRHKIDVAFIVPLTLIYAIVAYVNLGSNDVPQKGYVTKAAGESWTVDLGTPQMVDRVWIYSGIGDGTYRVEGSADGLAWGPIVQSSSADGKTIGNFGIEIKRNGPYLWTWSGADLSRTEPYRFIRWTVEQPGERLIEVVASRIDGDPRLKHYVAIPAVSIKAGAGFQGSAEDLNSLIDEQASFAQGGGYWTGMHFDEIYHARTAWEQLNHMEPYEYTHPPLGKIMIGWGIEAFGMTPFGWRFVGTLFGVLMLPLLYLLARMLFGRPELAILAAAFFAVDFMHFTQTRIATIDTYVVFWILAMFAAFWPWFKRQMSLAGWGPANPVFVATASLKNTVAHPIPITPVEQTAKPGASIERRKALFFFGLTGVCFALGVSSKWTAMYAAGGILVLFVIGLIAGAYGMTRRNKPDNAGNSARRAQRARMKNAPTASVWAGEMLWPLLVGLVCFIAIPAVVYFLSYIPYFLVPGHQATIDEVLNWQKRMYDYHSTLKADHPFGSKWYEWPLMIKPIWYYSGGDVAPEGMKSSIASFGNPVVWWGGLIAFFGMIVMTIRRRDILGLIIGIGFLAEYLPWAIVPRLTFIYHYFPSVPFLILSIVYVIGRWSERSASARPVGYVFLGVAGLLFVAFYPVLSGLTVPAAYIDGYLRWLPSWFF